MKFIGKIIVKKERGKFGYVVMDFGNSENNKYKIFVKDNPCYFNEDTDYPLGEMLKLINLEKGDNGEVIYNDLPKEIMNIANKEVVLLGLE